MRIRRTDLLEARPAGDRTLVVVFLRGGADGLSLVVPHALDGYYRSRPTIAIPKSATIDLDGVFGIHERLKSLMPHWQRGALRIVHGVGSSDDSRSHFEAQDFMEHGGSPGAGWLARYLRARNASAPLATVAIGTTMPESLRGAPGGIVLQRIADFDLAGGDQRLVAAIEGLYDRDVSPLRAAAKATFAAERRLRELRTEPSDSASLYPDSVLGRGLREIAMLVKADVGLVATTVDAVGGALGWDTHFVQSAAIGPLITDLGDSIAAFLEDLGSLRSHVTIVCMTEFGRRVAENTSLGTDHGAGSVMFVIDDEPPGGAGLVRGFDSLDESDLVGSGDVPVRIDFREELRPVLAAHAPGMDVTRCFPA